MDAIVSFAVFRLVQDLNKQGLLKSFFNLAKKRGEKEKKIQQDIATLFLGGSSNKLHHGPPGDLQDHHVQGQEGQGIGGRFQEQAREWASKVHDLLTP